MIKGSNTIDFKVISEISVEKIYMYTHISSYILLIKKYMELTVCCYCLQTRIVYMNYCASLTTETEDIILLPISGACSAESVPQNFITSGFRVVLRRAYIYPEYGVREWAPIQNIIPIIHQIWYSSYILCIYEAYLHMYMYLFLIFLYVNSSTCISIPMTCLDHAVFFICITCIRSIILFSVIQLF